MSMEATSNDSLQKMIDECKSVPYLATLIFEVLERAGLYIVSADKESSQ